LDQVSPSTAETHKSSDVSHRIERGSRTSATEQVEAKDTQRAFFNNLASRRARDAKRHRTYYRDRERWLQAFLAHSVSIIEPGCGTGLSISTLPQSKKAGFDFAEEMVATAKTSDNSTDYFVDNLLHLQHRETYDYVLLLDTVNFLSEVQVAFQNIRSNLCHDRTRLILTYYNFLWQPLFLVGEFLGWKTKFPEQNWLNSHDLENLLTLSGFEVVQESQRVLCPVGIPLLEPLCNRFLVSLPFLRSLALVKVIVARPIGFPRKEYSVTVLSAMRNEKGNVQRIADAMPAMGLETEVVFIEGHSTDGTWEEIQRIEKAHHGSVKIKGVKQSGKGKGNALHDGVAASSGEILFIYDGDFTVHPTELQKLYDVFAEGRAEFINASRLVYPMQEGAMRLLNIMGNKIFSSIFSWLFSQRLVDVLSPVKGAFRCDYEAVITRMDPFGDFDFYLGAAAKHLRMREVPVHYLERTYGTTKMQRFRHGWRLFTMCLSGAKRLKWV
jgi:hypothetical protein